MTKRLIDIAFENGPAPFDWDGDIMQLDDKQKDACTYYWYDSHRTWLTDVMPGENSGVGLLHYLYTEPLYFMNRWLEVNSAQYRESPKAALESEATWGLWEYLQAAIETNDAAVFADMIQHQLYMYAESAMREQMQSEYDADNRTDDADRQIDEQLQREAEGRL